MISSRSIEYPSKKIISYFIDRMLLLMAFPKALSGKRSPVKKLGGATRRFEIIKVDEVYQIFSKNGRKYFKLDRSTPRGVLFMQICTNVFKFQINFYELVQIFKYIFLKFVHIFTYKKFP